jgi:hypothetical protein
MELTKETLDAFFKSIGITNNLIYILLATLVLNIIATVLRFVFDTKIKDREKSIHKKNLINTKAIKVQEKIYEKIEKLSLYTKGEEQAMLAEIQTLQRYTANKRIYLSNKIFTIIENLLDYYRNLLTDHRKKDIMTEQKLFEEYVKEFNK